MGTLNIRVVGGNTYFKFGIISLMNIYCGCLFKQVNAIPDDATDYHISFDLHREIASIKTDNIIYPVTKDHQVKSLNSDIFIPFNCRDYSLFQVEVKLRKLIEITTVLYLTPLTLEQVITEFGLKRYLQLSQSEFAVLVMIGQGLDCHLISKHIARSYKTVRNHYRSACHKLGFTNQADFFRFAHSISSENQGVINTLCL